jgi:ketosteroid isomerase-like protein
MHPFREAVERGDTDAAVDLLADDVVFRSPAVFKPYEGRETVETILRTVFSVFEDFRYTDELAGDGAHALIFEARVGERSLQGLDLIRSDADGRIVEFTVMIRPASGLMALAERMGPALEAAGV